MAREDTVDTQMTRTAPRSRTRELVSAALIAALMAATSWMEIRFGPVPFTLQTAFVLLAALILSPGWAATSMGIYLVLGAVGLPVFSGGTGGLGMIASPTGGFLVAFPLAAAAGSITFRMLARGRAGAGAIATVAAVIVVEAVIYGIGVPWLMAVTGLHASAALGVAMLPFLVPDAVKAVVAVAVATAIRRAMPA